MKNKTLKEAFKDSMAILPGYIVLGIGFGMVLKNNGYGFIYAFLMSTFIYAGSMQYVTISLLSSGASLITSALMCFVVNIRHLFYGIAVLDKYQKIKRHKLYDIFALTDETFSIVISKELKEDINEEDYYFYLSLFNQMYWLLGSLMGSLIGNVFPFDTTGIEFSMTALFICVVINQIKDKQYSSQLIGFIVSLLCLFIFSKDSFIIPSIVLIIIGLILVKGKKDE